MTTAAIVEIPDQMPDRVIEAGLRRNGQLIVERAKAITITTNEDFQNAAELGKQIKQSQSQIKDYWAGPKEAAHRAHAEICTKERDMLRALEEAERILKSTMTRYTLQIEEARRKAEAEMRKRQQEEQERFLAAAVAAEAKGDELGVVSNMAMAEVVQDMAATINPVERPTVDGVSTRKVWRAEVIDDSQVPVAIAGAVIRPIDIRAIEKIAEATKGTIQVPGVRLFQETVMSIRK